MDGIRPPVSRVRLILLALLAWSPAVAHAQAPAPAPAAPAETPAPDSDGELLAAPDVPAPGEAPTAPAARVPIAGYELGGQRVDPDEQLMALLASIAPVGEPFIETGPSDRIGRPLGTIPRLAEVLDGIGYRSNVSKKAAGGGVTRVGVLTRCVHHETVPRHRRSG